ncbi:charged multivesicular body protein 7-like [Xenopus laevis]|uniref:Charged multivesicular body protein 7-like n=1 Tax=Xenopus laevis TaxID=8355 RepID=A0A8J1MNI9_XENLA|nr:charged multivesicular body protein 7-like [Xenopus laevis]XP_041442997.1 charged multivesicular body protein 7-like [Xenopus laevis]
MGVSALKQALKDVTLEKAESIVDQIQEYCDLQDDLSQTLSSVTDADVDSDDLERELNEILQNEEMIIDLPDVPSGPVIISPQRPTEWKMDQAAHSPADGSFLRSRNHAEHCQSGTVSS